MQIFYFHGAPTPHPRNPESSARLLRRTGKAPGQCTEKWVSGALYGSIKPVGLSLTPEFHLCLKIRFKRLWIKQITPLNKKSRWMICKFLKQNLQLSFKNVSFAPEWSNIIFFFWKYELKKLKYCLGFRFNMAWMKWDRSLTGKQDIRIFLRKLLLS